MAKAVTLAGASSGELEVEAEGLDLAVDKMAELAAHAERWVSIAERFLAAFPHVRMGPTEADDAEVAWLIDGAGTKEMGWGRRHSSVRVMTGRW